MPPSPTTNTFPGTTPLLAGWLSCATASCSLLAGVPVLHGDDGTFFEKRIRPILVEHCIECHGPDPASRRGGLRLDGPAAILAGGESGPVVVPGSPESSRLHRAVSYLDPEFQMPPRGRLDERDREAIRTWIASGAAMPAAAPARP
ncbi:MAG: c-type cytochrome domain-containing protein, partial [Planctomycetota bacterium]|nr:c-type cytochrome domain-containing protein [Planctomycetota bacterium]